MRAPVRTIGVILALVVVIAVSFAWGVAYTRDYVFPHAWVQSARRALGLETARSPVNEDSASGGVSVRTTSRFEQIRALPYVGTSNLPADPGRTGGVVLHDPARAFQGTTLFTAGHADEARLIDMEGNTVHRWALPRDRVVWDSPLARRERSGWRSAHFGPDLSLLALYDYLGLVKLDRDSEPQWVHRGGAHHGFWIEPDGRIYLLTHREERVPELHPRLPIVVDHVTVLGPDGGELGSHSILRYILDSDYAFLLPVVNHVDSEHAIDLLHTNSIQVLDGGLVSRSPIFTRGNLLVSIRNISAVMILDPRQRTVVWAWGPSNVSYQHSARLLPGGGLLLFDNGLSGSSVIELDPLTRRLAWKYRGTRSLPLASPIYGAVSRLPNGNTLITDSMQARALEVAPDGTPVWVFENPLTHEGRPTALFEVTRYPPDYLQPAP